MVSYVMKLRHRERSNTCERWRWLIQARVSNQRCSRVRSMSLEKHRRCRCVCLSRGRARAAWRRHVEFKRNWTETRTREKKKETRSPSEMTSCTFRSAAFPSVWVVLYPTFISFNVAFSLCIASPKARPHKKRVHMTSTQPREQRQTHRHALALLHASCSNLPSSCVV